MRSECQAASVGNEAPWLQTLMAAGSQWSARTCLQTDSERLSVKPFQVPVHTGRKCHPPGRGAVGGWLK